MPHLPAVSPAALGALVAFGVAAVFIVIWLWARASRTRRLIVQTNASAQIAMIQLERIANAMDRIALSAEAREISMQPPLAKRVKDAS